MLALSASTSPTYFFVMVGIIARYATCTL
jgi:hypothetical protein